MIVVVNYLAVLVAAMIAMVIGGLWYSPVLFGKQWMKLRGMDPAAMANMKMPMQSMLIEFITTLVMAFVIAEFAAWVGAATLMGGIVLGVWLWLGFAATLLVGMSVWEGRPWGLFFINGGLRLVNIVVMAAIIGAWHL
jgi:hypothetical protein